MMTKYAKDLQIKYNEALVLHGEEKCEKAKKLTKVTTKDFFYWVAMPDDQLDIAMEYFL